MLYKFLAENRQLLVDRCKAKVARRFEPVEPASLVNNGVPLFLEQVIETLRHEQTTSERIGRAAALHGAELLRLGFSVDQVVHDYGDVCQAVTALAVERSTEISTDEFRTLNRCLDNAIADAVTAFGDARQKTLDGKTETKRQLFVDYLADHRRLVAIALHSFAAIKTGNIGIGGATGMLLEHTLKEIGALTDRFQPEA
jgi:hypothetical protein